MRVWISHKNKVISTWNIIFDEYTFFDDKSESLFLQIIIKINNLIIKIRLLEVQTTNKYFFEKDEKILKFSFDSENNEKSDTEKIIMFNEKKNYKLVRILEDILLTLSFFKINIEITFHVQLLIRINNQHQTDKKNSVVL